MAKSIVEGMNLGGVSMRPKSMVGISRGYGACALLEHDLFADGGSRCADVGSRFLGDSPEFVDGTLRGALISADRDAGFSGDDFGLFKDEEVGFSSLELYLALPALE